MFNLGSSTVWNLWLAFIPMVLAHVVVAIYGAYKRGPSPMLLASLIFMAVLWLAWLPNTCYLLTEWRHLLEIVDKRNLGQLSIGRPELYLIIGKLAMFYLWYSLSGVLAFVLAIRPIERILRENRIPFWVCAIPLFLMLSVGVYLGLVLRFNSWDLGHRPGHVFASVLNIAERPLLLRSVLFFALMLWGLYEAVDLWMDGIAERWMKLRRRWRGERVSG
ncbi:DUF1361 domain-containing protein [bacterium]|nr:MAG: DUF1361 domain-containing protein [bacterium]